MVLKNYIEKYADGGKSDAKSRQREAYDFFLEKGLTPAQASGIVGNLMQESYADLRTNVVGDKQLGPKGEAYGIAQWRSDRKDNLFKVRPEDHDTLKGQLEFIWWELNNTEKKAFNKLMESKTPSEAAYNFGLHYERPKTVEGSRLKNAQSVYSNFYSEQPNMSEQPNTVVNSEGLTEGVVINNDFTPFETKDNISTFTPNIDFLKFDKIQALEAERAKRQEEIMKNLNVMADTPEKREEVQEMEQFDLGFDPYNYINIEGYQDGGKVRPYTMPEGTTYRGSDIPYMTYERKRMQPKDERLLATSKKDNAEVPIKPVVKQKDLLGELPLNQQNKYDIENPIVLTYNKTQKELEKKRDGKKNLLQFDGKIEGEISTEGASKDDIKKIQQMLSDKGYNLDPNKTFRNKGIDGVVGSVTAKAIEDYNNSLHKSGYSSIKKGKGLLGNCTEKQCSEYVQNEMYRNINPDIDRNEWNKKLGIVGDAWKIGDNIIRAGGSKVGLNEVKPGDFLTVYTGGGSEYQKDADKYGTGTTHTAIVDEVLPDGSYYVLHNVHEGSKEKGFKGREYRSYVDHKNEMFDKDWGLFKVKGAYRPNISQDILRDKKPLRKDVSLEVDADSKSKLSEIGKDEIFSDKNAKEKVEETFIKPLNDFENKSKVSKMFNLDEEEYQSIAQATLGVLGQESKFGTDDRYTTKGKETLAKISKTVNSIVPKFVEDLLESAIGKNILKNDEVSKGAGQFKYDTNFGRDDLTEFGITKENFDEEKNAPIVTMYKLAKDYNKFLSQGFNKKEALYRAVVVYNGSLEGKSNGKSRGEWSNDYDVDYANKVFSFANMFSVKGEDDKYKTIVDEIVTEGKVVPWINKI